MSNPTDLTAAIEAANEITLRVQTKRGDCESAVTRIDELAEVCADFIRFNEDALLSLPTPVPTAKTAAEVAGGYMVGSKRLKAGSSPPWPIRDGSGTALALCWTEEEANMIAAALNAPAAAPPKSEIADVIDGVMPPVRIEYDGATAYLVDARNVRLSMLMAMHALNGRNSPAPPSPVAGEGGDAPKRVLRDDARESAAALKALPVMPGVGFLLVAQIHQVCDFVLALPVPTPGAGDAGGEVGK